MGSFSIWHWLVVLLVILLLFGGGKISGLMGDLAKGIKSFKQNMKEDDDKDASMAADAPSRPAGNLSGPGVNQARNTSTEPNTSNSSHPAA
ncbi:twin-arginine translocase TatA/TatE family subunit [Roseomonas sp. KE0001]|uniref:twin-arginine translocase TatA/TatE family subunit n=1 Tax=unclassified Roseomonas TaxID=2617492 RepID=UPI0018E03075|nr:twin-arginine translocase TatA/TatE family subunit [Roseomonas sp. KE0001]MBI0433599.1 twin-arginine translocase TatA/TatE family subunit [Roseomonas sp. KE0001]